MSTDSRVRPTRHVRDPALPIWTIAGVCWLATLVLEVSGAIEAGHHDVVLDGEGPSSLVRVAGFLLVWTVMVGAMMLPTMIPMARLVHAVTGPHAHAVRERTGLYAAYLAVWMLFGVAALVVIWLRWARRSWTGARRTTETRRRASPGCRGAIPTSCRMSRLRPATCSLWAAGATWRVTPRTHSGSR